MIGNSLIECNSYEMIKDGDWSWVEYEEGLYGPFDDEKEEEYTVEQEAYDEALEILLEYYEGIKEDLIDENLWD